MNVPSVGRTTAGLRASGSHSQTRPSGTSSQVSQVPHGVAPPAQLREVPVQIEYASTTWPSRSKRSAPTPPWRFTSSLFETYTQPPSPAGKVAPPSGEACHTYE